jgi:hypothetical protein
LDRELALRRRWLCFSRPRRDYSMRRAREVQPFSDPSKSAASSRQFTEAGKSGPLWHEAFGVRGALAPLCFAQRAKKRRWDACALLKLPRNGITRFDLAKRRS